MGNIIISLICFSMSVFYGLCGINSFKEYLKEPRKQTTHLQYWSFSDLPNGNAFISQTNAEIIFQGINGKKIKFVRDFGFDSGGREENNGGA